MNHSGEQEEASWPGFALGVFGQRYSAAVIVGALRCSLALRWSTDDFKVAVKWLLNTDIWRQGSFRGHESTDVVSMSRRWWEFLKERQMMWSKVFLCTIKIEAFFNNQNFTQPHKNRLKPKKQRKETLRFQNGIIRNLAESTSNHLLWKHYTQFHNFKKSKRFKSKIWFQIRCGEKIFFQINMKNLRS